MVHGQSSREAIEEAAGRELAGKGLESPPGLHLIDARAVLGCLRKPPMRINGGLDNSGILGNIAK
jgi:hypothetical protein